MEKQNSVEKLSIPLYQAKGWMKLLGVLSIIYGILIIFSIWGILICWLPIWMGVLLNKSANAIEIAQRHGDSIQFQLALDKLKTYFTIQGVLALIGLIIIGIGIVIALISGAAILDFLN